MATTKLHFTAENALFRAGTAFPQYLKVEGTTVPVSGLYFDASTEEVCFFRFRAVNYGSGNFTVNIGWYADSASSGGVSFGVSFQSITPNTDSQDVETKAVSTELIISDTHLGTTGQRAHDVIGSASALDSVAVDDWVVMKLARKPADAGDTMTGDAIVVMVDIAYSDT